MVFTANWRRPEPSRRPLVRAGGWSSSRRATRARISGTPSGGSRAAQSQVTLAALIGAQLETE